ncbi:MAG: GNAT family N-acetyltransferase [Sandaracinaceae bacterium]
MLVPRPHHPDDDDRWDAFVERCPKGTLLHTRRFLGYHGARFEDCSVWLERDGKPVAIFPAARLDDRVVSHPGSTFGGPLIPKIGAAEETFEVLSALGELYRGAGARRLELKLSPAHLSVQPDEPELSALFRLGGTVERMDLWSVVSLDRDRKRKDRASANRAERLGVTVAVEDTPDAYAEMHALLSDTLRRRHGARPVHDLEALLDLRRRLGGAQSLWVARAPSGVAAAACWLLRHREGVFHTQYLAASEEGRELRALDLVIERAIVHAQREGARTFSFGASTEEGGRTLNAPLHGFKSKWGGGAVVQHHCAWTLTTPAEET